MRAIYKMESFMLISLILFTNLANVLAQQAGPDFAYHGPTGPRYWFELFPEYCAGKVQSPINIISSQAEDTGVLPVGFNGYGPDDIPSNAKMQVVNNGHSVQLNLEGDYHIEGGPLSSIFQATQLHFHWGSQDDQGSEHTVDEKQYSAEMHVVHYDREKFDNFDDAVKVKNGVTVLGVFIQVTAEDNPGFDALLEGVAAVPFRDDTYDVPEVFPISSMLPTDEQRSQFFFYEGSLTTPVCNEVVQWIVYKIPVPISEKQISVFRSVYENAETDRNRNLVDNFRPTQPLNDRIIYSAKASLLTHPSMPFLVAVALTIHLFILKKH